MSCETNHAEIHKNLEAGPKYSTSTLKFQWSKKTGGQNYIYGFKETSWTIFIKQKPHSTITSSIVTRLSVVILTNSRINTVIKIPLTILQTTDHYLLLS
jgi:hypothetical protein